MTLDKNLNIGYCCINTELRKLGIFTSRTCRLDTVEKNGIDYIYNLAFQNINDLASVFRWNHTHNIFLYRMSSEMFPFATHPNYYQDYDWSRFELQLKNLGKLAKHYKQTITFHPGQYNQLTSNRDSVVQNSIIDINAHAKILDMMDCDNDSIIIIHGGSKSDGKNVCLDRLCKNFQRLSDSAQKRLVLENCEMAYSIQDLLPISQKLLIPIVIDYHHHNINPGSIKNDDELIQITNLVLQIWEKRNITPLFHLSESKGGVKITDSITTRRAHSDYVKALPNALLVTIQTNRINLDIEAKMKEQSVLYLYKKFNIHQN